MNVPLPPGRREGSEGPYWEVGTRRKDDKRSTRRSDGHPDNLEVTLAEVVTPFNGKRVREAVGLPKYHPYLEKNL